MEARRDCEELLQLLREPIMSCRGFAMKRMFMGCRWLSPGGWGEMSDGIALKRMFLGCRCRDYDGEDVRMPWGMPSRRQLGSV